MQQRCLRVSEENIDWFTGRFGSSLPATLSYELNCGVSVQFDRFICASVNRLNCGVLRPPVNSSVACTEVDHTPSGVYDIIQRTISLENHVFFISNDGSNRMYVTSITLSEEVKMRPDLSLINHNLKVGIICFCLRVSGCGRDKTYQAQGGVLATIWGNSLMRLLSWISCGWNSCAFPNTLLGLTDSFMMLVCFVKKNNGLTPDKGIWLRKLQHRSHNHTVCERTQVCQPIFSIEKILAEHV